MVDEGHHGRRAGGDRDVSARARRVVDELAELDRACYAAVHAVPTPTLDRTLARVSRSADHSVLWLCVAAGLAGCGRRPRRAALLGVGATLLTSTLVNALVKPFVRRGRPTRTETVRLHVVPIPHSTSYPSGHAASAFAFATAVAAGLPQLAAPLRLAAVTVAYSRVHTGVHYPGDVIAGAGIGAEVGTLVGHLARHHGLLPSPGRPPR